jgi:protein-disulfide isomerase
MPRPKLLSLVARRPWLTLAAALGLALMAGALIQRLPRAAVPLQLTPVVRAVLSDRGSPSIGSANADVVIVVFTDYQCPICKTTDPALMRLLARDPKVRVIFKDWPVFGARSHVAARAAIAAHEQGRYLAFHAGLMAARGRFEDDQIRRIALAAGVDWPRLQARVAANATELDAQIAGHATQAWSLGLQGTPGYLVGPYLIPGGLDDHHLAQAVRRARKAGDPFAAALRRGLAATSGDATPWSGHAAPLSPVSPPEG